MFDSMYLKEGHKENDLRFSLQQVFYNVSVCLLSWLFTGHTSGCTVTQHSGLTENLITTDGS